MDISSILSSLQPRVFDAGAIFSGAPSGKTVKGYAAPGPFTPAVDPDYIFHEQSRDIVVWFTQMVGQTGGKTVGHASIQTAGHAPDQAAIQSTHYEVGHPENATADPLYIYGPTGCGKTSCIKQIAARLNFPVFEVTGHSRLEFPELVGHHVVRQGSMAFEYGPLALAMRYGGLFLCNEIDLLDPSTAAGLNGILDGQPLCIPENGGELIVPHPMFRFAATANTNGGCDESGLYQGANKQNIAFMDRFMLCEVSYPRPEDEELLLEKTASQIPPAIRKKMVEYANEVRRLFMGESGNSYSENSIEVTLSTRTLLRWAALAIRYQPLARQGVQPVAHALDRALGFRACRETRAMLHELAQRFFPQT